MTQSSWKVVSRTRLLALMLAGALPVAGCGAGVQQRSGGGNPDQITQESLDELVVEYRTAYEAINRLRPQWLRERASPSFSDPGPLTATVYLDGIRYGDLGSLRNIRTDQVSSIEFLRATDATTRFGTGHDGGVILITTRR